MSEQHVKGLSELQKFLDQLPVKMERNVMRGALRSGMNKIKPDAQARVHSVSGELAAGLKVGTSSRGRTVTAKLKTTGPHGFVGRWVEFGTRAHIIAAKMSGSLAFLSVFAKEVMHPGSKPKPFMRPALDSQRTNAVNATAVYIRDRLETKHGLDTSGVMLDGDEYGDQI